MSRGRGQAGADARADTHAKAGTANATADAENAGAGGKAGEAGTKPGEGGRGNTGLAGRGGASGASGASSEPLRCQNDQDCDDELFCNGRKRCVEGSCRPGDAVVCTNPDAEHCVARCVEADSGAQCLVTAVDQDEDGVGSELCESAPGMDCDDSDPTVFADAPELCDGKDNDCNGKVDLDDGLQLAGTTTLIAQAMEIDVDGSSVSEAFRLVIERRGSATTGAKEALITATLSTTGEVSDETPLFDPEPDWTYPAPRIAWGGDTFGIVYTKMQCGGSGANAGCTNDSGFLRMGADGAIEAVTPMGRSQRRPGDIVYRSSGDWLVPYASSGALEINPWFADDTWAEGPIVPLAGGVPRIAASGTTSAVIWQEAAWGSTGPNLNDVGPIVWSLISAELELQVTQTLAAQGYRPSIAALPDGYGMAWLAHGAVVYEVRGSNTTLRCGPTDVVFGDLEAHWRDSVAMAHTPSGVLVVATDSAGGVVELFRFDEACHLVGRTVLGDTFTEPGWPNIAVSGGHVAVVWTERLSSNEYDGHARVFGEALCE